MTSHLALLAAGLAVSASACVSALDDGDESVGGDAHEIAEAACFTIDPDASLTMPGLPFNTISATSTYDHTQCRKAYIFDFHNGTTKNCVSATVRYSDQVPTTQSACEQTTMRVRMGVGTQALSDATVNGQWTINGCLVPPITHPKLPIGSGKVRIVASARTGTALESPTRGVGYTLAQAVCQSPR